MKKPSLLFWKRFLNCFLVISFAAAWVGLPLGAAYSLRGTNLGQQHPQHYEW